jgi:hypothetical protein
MPDADTWRRFPWKIGSGARARLTIGISVQSVEDRDGAVDSIKVGLYL